MAAKIRVIVWCLVFFLIAQASSCSAEKEKPFKYIRMNPISGVAGVPVSISTSITYNGFNGVGTVTISSGDGINSYSCQAALSNGVGNCKITFPKPGYYSIAAVYYGDKFVPADRATTGFTVVSLMTPTPSITTSLTILNTSKQPIAPGESAIVTVEVRSSSENKPTGNITIEGADGRCTGHLDNIGYANCSISFPTPGRKHLKVTYPGDGPFMSTASTSLTIDVAYKTQITLSSSQNPSYANQMVTMNAVVTNISGGPVPIGQILMYADGYPQCTVDLVDGNASCPFYFDKKNESLTIMASFTSPVTAPQEIAIFGDSYVEIPQQIIQWTSPTNTPSPKKTPTPTAVSSSGGEPGCWVRFSDDTLHCESPCPDPVGEPCSI